MSKDAKKISANRWLSLLWASGAAIYGWLLVGAIHKHRYEDVIWEVPPGTGLSLSGFLFGAGFLISRSVLKEGRTSPTEEAQNQGALTPIIVTLLPALFVVSALATLVLTLATYNGDWVDARQGLATAFASLIASVGVVVSVAVSYKSGEENRLAQEKNLATQLTHQRKIEDEKGEREDRKQDAELIKTLNDRLHEIIPRRYGKEPREVSASYFQLAALYRDWETLAASSKLVEGQKDTQQRNILKILFGVYEEEQSTENSNIGSGDSQDNAEEKQKDIPYSRPRSQADIRALNSVIQDIFPVARKEKSDGHEAGEKTQKDEEDKVYDLSYLDLRGLDFSNRHLSGATLVGAHLEGAELRFASLEGANLWGAHLKDADLEGADLMDACLEDTDLMDACLEVAILQGTHLEGAILQGTHLEGADLQGARLEDAYFFIQDFESSQEPTVRQRIINQLKTAQDLPEQESLLAAMGFGQELVDAIYKSHEEYWAE